MKKYCLFDLDGTIVKSEEGIFESVRYALAGFGITENDPNVLRAFIGPSLYESFRSIYNMSDEDANKAIERYREVYQAGNMYKVSLYDGIIELFEKIRRSGRVIVVVTSKPYLMAYSVLSHLGVHIYVEEVYSPELTEHTSDKSGLVAKFLADYGIGDLSSVVMIGDKVYDIIAANMCGIDSIGAAYGYGFEGELDRAKHLVSSPGEVFKYL